jgi:outer membrane protein TolC
MSSLPLQRQRREEIEAIYLGGQADITSLIIAEQELRLSQVKLVGLEETRRSARAALERAVGGPAAALQQSKPNLGEVRIGRKTMKTA